MIFSSFAFLIFLPTVLVLLVLRKSNEYRKIILLVASCYFYGYWDWRFLFLILISTVIDFICGKKIFESDDNRKRKNWLIVSMSLNLGLLGFFKYFNFFIDSANTILVPFGWNTSTLDIILPVGISFYTFQTMSYTIDIYRKNLKPAKTFLDFALFVAFFPQLVAGPIVRAVEFIPQLENPITLRKRNAAIGIQIFIIGMIKKLLIADRLAIYVDAVFQAPELYSSLSIWGAVVAYSIQIFCDFSGYSDMAIGIARIMGFRLPLNFRMPYISLSITEFWRRWHISLSSWLKDYLYISLGGNRCGKWRQSANLIITMLLGGLWHGASWNFVVWGGLHGVALFIHKIYSSIVPKSIKKLSYYKFFSWALTYVFVLYCWVFFRARTFNDSFLMIKRMTCPVFSEGLEKYVYMPFLLILPFVVGMHMVGAYWNFDDRYKLFDLRSFKGAFLLTLSLFLLFFFSPLNTSPFIYFQF